MFHIDDCRSDDELLKMSNTDLLDHLLEVTREERLAWEFYDDPHLGAGEEYAELVTAYSKKIQSILLARMQGAVG